MSDTYSCVFCSKIMNSIRDKIPDLSDDLVNSFIEVKLQLYLILKKVVPSEIINLEHNNPFFDQNIDYLDKYFEGKEELNQSLNECKLIKQKLNSIREQILSANNNPLLSAQFNRAQNYEIANPLIREILAELFNIYGVIVINCLPPKSESQIFPESVDMIIDFYKLVCSKDAYSCCAIVKRLARFDIPFVDMPRDPEKINIINHPSFLTWFENWVGYESYEDKASMMSLSVLFVIISVYLGGWAYLAIKYFFLNYKYTSGTFDQNILYTLISATLIFGLLYLITAGLENTYFFVRGLIYKYIIKSNHYWEISEIPIYTRNGSNHVFHGILSVYGNSKKNELRILVNDGKMTQSSRYEFVSGNKLICDDMKDIECFPYTRGKLKIEINFNNLIIWIDTGNWSYYAKFWEIKTLPSNIEKLLKLK